MREKGLRGSSRRCLRTAARQPPLAVLPGSRGSAACQGQSGWHAVVLNVRGAPQRAGRACRSSTASAHPAHLEIIVVASRQLCNRLARRTRQAGVAHSQTLAGSNPRGCHGVTDSNRVIEETGRVRRAMQHEHPRHPARRNHCSRRRHALRCTTSGTSFPGRNRAPMHNKVMTQKFTWRASTTRVRHSRWRAVRLTPPPPRRPSCRPPCAR